VRSATSLGTGDVDRLLALVAQAAAATDDEPFDFAVVERLSTVVPADQAGYFEYRYAGDDMAPGTTVNVYNVKQPGPDVSWCSDDVCTALPSWPLHDSHHAEAVAAVLSSDRLTTRARKLRNPWYLRVMRPSGIEHELKLWLPAPRGAVRGFFLVREAGRSDFDERDRALLTALRSPFATIRERWERHHRPPALTDRERAVLLLIRAGLTNKEVAARLEISSATVRTHLENIFAKLGVHTRTAAIAAAFG
jgi:DNA-binding CsgD family transcriptional regulator